MELSQITIFKLFFINQNKHIILFHASKLQLICRKSVYKIDAPKILKIN
jgi:hypothetical protein